MASFNSIIIISSHICCSIICLIIFYARIVCDSVIRSNPQAHMYTFIEIFLSHRKQHTDN